MRTYYVYILTSLTRVLYIGVTSDLKRRPYEHKHKLIVGFTAKYNVNRLVYFEETSNSRAAVERERQLKGWRREKKVASYDLRPLLLGLSVRASGGDGVTLAMRLRQATDAVGRPEEVMAALGEPPAPPLAGSLEVRAIARERLVLADDPDAPPG